LETPNLKYIKKISGGDKDFEKNILAVLKLEFPADLAAIKMNFNANNFEQLLYGIHKIKNTLGILGMEKSVEVAMKCEKSINEGKMVNCNHLLLILERIDVHLREK
jgi:HPt (histidine-containing phosphotransfer) domain-containing protein